MVKEHKREMWEMKDYLTHSAFKGDTVKISVKPKGSTKFMKPYRYQLE